MFSEPRTISSKPGVEAWVLYSLTAAAELRSCWAGRVSSISAMRASLSAICWFRSSMRLMAWSYSAAVRSTSCCAASACTFVSMSSAHAVCCERPATGTLAKASVALKATASGKRWRGRLLGFV